MRILHLTPYYAPAYAFGGVVRVVEGMARALARRGHEVTVLTTDALDPQRRVSGRRDELCDGVRVVRVPNAFTRGTLNLSTPRGLRETGAALVDAADLIHCHEFRTVENLLITPLAAARGVPLVLSPHGTLTLKTGRGGFKAVWDALLSPAAARRFAGVIGLTAHEADEARALWRRLGVAPNDVRFAVVPNGIDSADFAALPPRDTFRVLHGLGDGPVCLYLGRLHPRKGAHLLAQAFRMTPLPDARLVIAGPDEGGARLIAPFMDGRVVLTGYLDPPARLAALAAADVFALPAEGEGLPIAALEALAAGLPVILTPGCHLPEAAEAGAGLIVERDAAALSAALRALLTDAPHRQAMSAAARHLAQTQFTWESIAARLEAVYDDVMIAHQQRKKS